MLQHELQAIRSALPRTNLDIRHTVGCTVLPNRQELLSKLPAGGLVAELGVASGDFSTKILELSAPRKLYLIDSWEKDRYQGGLETIRSKFRNEVATGRVEIVVSNSVSAMSGFPDNFFDWVYIDTNHRYDNTAAELSVCEKKVKSGGRIAGHDFCVGNVVRGKLYGVIQACSKFCVDRDWGFEFLTLESGGHFSFCLKKL